MRFPDEVTIIRPIGEDPYGGTQRKTFSKTSRRTSPGFLVGDGTLILPASADARDGDRFQVNGRTFSGDVTPARSPSRTVLLLVKIREV